jgi:hypothetical protein
MRYTTSIGVVLGVASLVWTSACSSTSTDRSGSGTPATEEPSASTVVAAPAPVPAQYQALYDTLSAGLDSYQRAVDALPVAPPGTAAPVLATELLPANGNRLTQLLQPATMTGVNQWLDRLQSIGVHGVTLGVKLPMLLPEFGPDGSAYTIFFATVADAARAHDMTVDVELGALFCGTVYAACDYTYPGGYQDFVRSTVAQARIVIDQIRPTYLTILSEPTTEASLTKVADFSTPEGAARYVHDVLAGIGDRGETKVGAGAGAWLDPTFNEAILREAIDYLTVHIYPVTGRTTDNLLRDTDLAHAAGKPLVADEVGLYKTEGSDQTTPATADTSFRRDSFSFFEPLDIRFAAVTATWAEKSGVSYVSPYWAGQFFSYIDWTPALDAAPYAQLSESFNAQVRQAFQAQQLTRYGEMWLAQL